MRVEGEVVGEIGPGLCVLLGVARGDDEAAAERLAGRVARLRIFENDEGKFDRSVLDAGGAVARRQPVHADRGHGQGQQAELLGRRAARRLPSRSTRASVRRSRELGVPVETGVFGARMRVELANDGPVTILLDA